MLVGLGKWLREVCYGICYNKGHVSFIYISNNAWGEGIHSTKLASEKQITYTNIKFQTDKLKNK